MATSTELRQGSWLALIYYYLATLIGLVILLVGLIGGLHGLVTAAWPELSSQVRYSNAYPVYGPDGKASTPPPQEQERLHAEAIHDARIGGYADALYGAAAVVVGAPVFAWHLRQARRREPGLMS